MSSGARSFAIVPAAGRSQRMGSPKLLLPWRGRAILEHVLDAWNAGGVTRAVIVVRADDAPLRDLTQRLEADMVAAPTPPPEMKDSVQLGLDWVKEHYAPLASDVWLMAPADIPGLSPHTIRGLLAAHDPANPAVLVPSFAGRRGHPVLFPWPLAGELTNLGRQEGLNRLIERVGSREIPFPPDAAASFDVDTPGDYQALVGDHEG